MKQQLIVTTVGGQSFTLSPVPMKRMPSGSPVDWIKFQGVHVAGTSLSDVECEKIQGFMRKHKTEALTDGRRNYTLAGGMLAECDPSQIQ
jgi:hypothetical protein